MSDWTEEFYPAIIYSNARRYMFVVLSDKRQAFCLPHQVKLSPGCHQCEVGLPPGAPVQVRLKPNDPPHRAVPFKVTELRCDLDFEGVEESGRVHTWHGNHGSVARPCGCHLFLSTAKSEYDFVDLKHGDEVEFAVKRSPKKNWIGELISATRKQHA